MDFLARYIFTFMPPVHQMPVDFKAADVPGQWIEFGGLSSLFTEMTVEAFGEVFSPFPELCSFMLYYIYFLTILGGGLLYLPVKFVSRILDDIIFINYR
jgi:hypothetical protein